jgi:hypothetical protein
VGVKSVCQARVPYSHLSILHGTCREWGKPATLRLLCIFRWRAKSLRPRPIGSDSSRLTSPSGSRDNDNPHTMSGQTPRCKRRGLQKAVHALERELHLKGG